jgi:hypothetical protein
MDCSTSRFSIVACKYILKAFFRVRFDLDLLEMKDKKRLHKINKEFDFLLIKNYPTSEIFELVAKLVIISNILPIGIRTCLQK